VREAVRRSITWTEEREALERRADRLMIGLGRAPVPMA